MMGEYAVGLPVSSYLCDQPTNGNLTVYPIVRRLHHVRHVYCKARTIPMMPEWLLTTNPILQTRLLSTVGFQSVGIPMPLTRRFLDNQRAGGGKSAAAKTHLLQREIFSLRKFRERVMSQLPERGLFQPRHLSSESRSGLGVDLIPRTWDNPVMEDLDTWLEELAALPPEDPEVVIVAIRFLAIQTTTQRRLLRPLCI